MSIEATGSKPHPRFLYEDGNIRWHALRTECPTCFRAALILRDESTDDASDDEVNALLFERGINPAQISHLRADVLALAGHARRIVEKERRDMEVVTSIPFRAFRNQLCILKSVDRDELASPYAALDSEDWRRFVADPYMFFLKAEDAHAAALWTVIQRRLKAELRVPAGESV